MIERAELRLRPDIEGEQLRIPRRVRGRRIDPSSLPSRAAASSARSSARPKPTRLRSAVPPAESASSATSRGRFSTSARICTHTPLRVPPPTTHPRWRRATRPLPPESGSPTAQRRRRVGAGLAVPQRADRVRIGDQLPARPGLGDDPFDAARRREPHQTLADGQDAGGQELGRGIERSHGDGGSSGQPEHSGGFRR